MARDPLDRTAVDAIDERSALSLAPDVDGNGFTLSLRYYGAEHTTVAVQVSLTDDQVTKVREFWHQVHAMKRRDGDRD